MNRILYILLPIVIVVCQTAFSYHEKIKLYDSLSSKVELGRKIGDIFSSRIQINTPSSVKSLTVLLSGKPTKKAFKITLYDFVGGAPAPIYNQTALYTTLVDKKRDGLETVTIDIPDNLVVKSKVLFIVYDIIKEGVFLIADSRKSEPTCISNIVFYLSQVKKHDNKWYNLPFNINIEVVVDRIEDRQTLLKVDTLMVEKEKRYTGPFKYIVSEDIDNDGFKDFIVNNRLFINKNGVKFITLDKEVELLNKNSLLTILIDANNDGIIDILQLGVDSSRTSGILSIGKGNWDFLNYTVSHPKLFNPTTFSIGYINEDLVPDVFVGQSSDVLQEAGDSFVLFGDESGRSFSNSILRDEKTGENLHVTSSSIASFNNEGKTELYLSVQSDDHSTKSYFVNYQSSKWVFNYISSIKAYENKGCSWDYVDKDEYLDILTPQKFTPTFTKDINTNVFFTTSLETLQLTSEDFSFKYSGGSWTDINRDGLMDFVIVSDCNCSYLQVFIQTEEGKFHECNMEYDIPMVSGVKEIAIVDVDNNSMPDILCISSDSLVILKNTLSPKNINTISVSNKKYIYGAKIKVYTDKGIYQKQNIAGKGFCVQQPTDLISLPVDTKIDSVLYTEPNNDSYLKSESATSNSVIKTEDMTRKLYKEKGGIEIRVHPNPVTDKVTFLLNESNAEEEELIIENMNGQVVHTIRIKNLRSIVWDCTTEEGIKLPTGAYYVVIGSENKVKAAKFVVVK